MVAKGSLGKYKPVPPSPEKYRLLVGSLIVFSVVAGYFAGIQPVSEWRFFSWHPFLMTCGMVGLAGIGAVTKKLGGYENTKLHAIIGWSSVLVSFAGLYIIYKNKENNGYQHLQSNHSWAGAFCLVNCVGLGLAGSIFLHPDFGMDKTNKTIRFAHKTASRLTLMLAWVTAFLGLYELVPVDNPLLLVSYGVPLALLVPYVLM